MQPLPSPFPLPQESFLQQFREIAPTIRHDMDMNRMCPFMDPIDNAARMQLDFPVGENVDPLQFRRDAAPIRQETQAVTGLDELFQEGLGHVWPLSLGDKINNA